MRLEKASSDSDQAGVVPEVKKTLETSSGSDQIGLAPKVKKTLETAVDTCVNTSLFSRINHIGIALLPVLPALQPIAKQISLLDSLQCLYVFSTKVFTFFKPAAYVAKPATAEVSATQTVETSVTKKKATWQETAIKICFDVNRSIKSIRFLDAIRAIDLTYVSKGLVTVAQIGSFTCIPLIVVKDAILSAGCLLETYHSFKKYRKIEVLIAFKETLTPLKKEKTAREAESLKESEIETIIEMDAETEIETENTTGSSTDAVQKDLDSSLKELHILRKSILMTIVDDITCIAMIIFPYIGVLFSIVALGATAPLSLQLTFLVGLVGIVQIGYTTYYKRTLEKAEGAIA